MEAIVAERWYCTEHANISETYGQIGERENQGIKGDRYEEARDGDRMKRRHGGREFGSKQVYQTDAIETT